MLFLISLHKISVQLEIIKKGHRKREENLKLFPPFNDNNQHLGSISHLDSEINMIA